MNDEPAHGPELIAMRDSDVKYERTDASVRGVVWFLGILTVCGLLIQLLLAGLYKYMAGPDVSLYEHTSAASVYSKPPRVPQPRLQSDPVADRSLLVATQEQRLNSYGWVDQNAGVVHIPIERAIDLLAQRGVPSGTPLPASQFRETLNMGAAAPGGVVIPQSVAQKKTPPQK